jgi:hypothetical protein
MFDRLVPEFLKGDEEQVEVDRISRSTLARSVIDKKTRKKVVSTLKTHLSTSEGRKELTRFAGRSIAQNPCVCAGIAGSVFAVSKLLMK